MSEELMVSVRLGEIAHVEMGQSPDSRFVYDDPFLGYPFLQGNAEFGPVFPEPKYGCTRPTKLAKTDDVLISVRAPVGSVNVADRDFCIGRGLAAIRFRGIKPSLAAELLLRQNVALRRVAQGTTFEAINKSDLLNLNLQIPDSEELPTIAKILDTLDTAIRETEAIITKLKAVKQGLLHDLLTRGIDANGELRPPQSEAPHLYNHSPLGWIPKEWEFCRVGEACEIHNDLRFPIASVLREQIQGIYPYYGPTGILDYINEYRLDGTYVLIGEDGDHFLKFNDWPMTQLVSGKFNVNNHAHVLSGLRCATEWIGIWFRHRDITFFLTRQGAGRFKLNKVALINLPFVVPLPLEQQAIRNAVAKIDLRIEAENLQKNKLCQLKSALMNDLLTGRVRVTPLLELS